MIKSPLRYPGGKSLFLERICPLLGSDFAEYREPFAGGASVFFRMRQLFPDRRFWINDLFDDLYLFWRELRDDPESLARIVDVFRTKSLDLERTYRFIKERSGSLSEAERAALFFVMNRISFSGTSFSGGFSREAAESRFTESSIERLKEAAPLLCGVKLTRFDYEEVISAPSDGPVVIYADPPYLSAERSKLYGNDGDLHAGFDHERFASAMRRSGYRWVVSYDDCEEVRRLFSFANVMGFEISYGSRLSSGDGKVGRELLITNFEVER